MEKYNHKYGADQIQVLEGLEAVRKRPGMYIGSTSVRGLHHLVYEIVDNCVDEAMAGYCTEINVAIEPGNVISVEDNGRGIPVEIHPKTHISTAETVYTVLHAGGKFGGDSGYKVSGGLHGVGASVVNALSDWTEVTIQRDGGIYQMYFEKGKTVKKLEKIGNSKKTGTKVRFLADETIFETRNYDYETLETRFREIAFLTKGLKITLEDTRDPENVKKAEFCYEGGLISFVEFLNKSKEMQMVRITTQDGKKVEGLLNVTKDSNGNVKEMYVDIGVDSADEVKALGIDVGDMVCFASEARQIQDKVIAGKAMDDRTGCYVMIEAMKRIHGDVENDIYFVGTSSEEVGVRGGKTATHLIDPDIVFALDVANNPELVKNYTNHRLIGKGPMIVHYDKTLSPNKKLIKYVKELASKHGIPYQSDMFGGGGTDAGNAHLEKGGRLALVLGIPLRYCHGSYSFVHSDDLESLTQLVNCLIDHLTYQDYQNFINFIGG